MDNTFGIKTLLHYVEDKLIAQGRPSLNSNEDCSYRGSEDLKCGIGFLIPDNLYTESMEGKLVASLTVEVAGGIHNPVIEYIANLFNISFENDLLRVLRDIQAIHDSFDSEQSEISFKEYIKECFQILHECFNKYPDYYDSKEQ